MAFFYAEKNNMAAKGFNLVARLNFQGPYNLDKVIGRAQRMVQGGIKGKVDLTFNKASERQLANLQKSLRDVNKELKVVATNAAKASEAISKMANTLSGMNKSTNATVKEVNNLNNATKSTSKATEKMNSEMAEFGRVAGLAVRRFAGFTIGTGIIFGVGRAFTTATAEAIAFERELIKVAQVTGGTTTSLSGLTDEITRLSGGLGVSSADLLEVSRTLAQAGLSASQTKTALEALAKSSLAPTFNNIQNTTEGAIAAIRQFKFGAESLESVLGSVNAVAGQFAVEAEDIISAVRRTGGVFAAASGDIATLDESVKLQRFREFIALFTSVRATTRESAETIATGLRTVFTRIQRGSTIKQLQNLGINLQDTKGQFLGVFEAVEQLSKGLATLPTTDARFNQIIEELGGFRQVGKVIPLIREFNTAQDALKVAQGGVNSITEDATLAQQSLAVQITRVREEFAALIRELTDTDSFRSIVKLILSTTSGLIKLADNVKPILPILTAFAAIKGTQAILGFGKGFSKGLRNVSNIDTAGIGSSTAALAAATGNSSAGVTRNTAAIDKNTQAILNLTAAIRSSRLGGRGNFATGGIVPGSGNRDTYPANLMPGEFVIRKRVVEQVGADNLHALNNGRIGFNKGGIIDQKHVGVAILNSENVGDSKVKVEVGNNEYSFGLIRQALSEERNKEFNKHLDSGIISGINTTVFDLGGQTVNDEKSQANLLKSVNTSTRGQLFDDALTVIHNGPVFNEALDPTRPIDYVGKFGDGNRLADDFSRLAGLYYVEAKASKDEAKPSDLRGKIKSQILLENPDIKEAEDKKVKTNLTDKELKLIKINVQNARDKGSEPASDVWKHLKKAGYINSIGKDVPTNKEGKVALIQQANKDLGFGFAAGGRSPSSTDTIPALLTPGEFVFNRDAAQQIGYQNLEKLNKGNIQGFANGGLVGGRTPMARGGDPVIAFARSSDEARQILEDITREGQKIGASIEELDAAVTKAARDGLKGLAVASSSAERDKLVKDPAFQARIKQEGLSRLGLRGLPSAPNGGVAQNTGVNLSQSANVSPQALAQGLDAGGAYVAIQRRTSELMKKQIPALEARAQAEAQYGTTLKKVKEQLEKENNARLKNRIARAGNSAINAVANTPGAIASLGRKATGTSGLKEFFGGGFISTRKAVNKAGGAGAALRGTAGTTLALVAPQLIGGALGDTPASAATSAGLTGATTGGLVGFQTAGVPGAIVGAVAGGVSSAVSAFNEAEIKNATGALEDSISKAADAFSDFLKDSNLEKLSKAIGDQFKAVNDLQSTRDSVLGNSAFGAIRGTFGLESTNQEARFQNELGFLGTLGALFKDSDTLQKEAELSSRNAARTLFGESQQGRGQLAQLVKLSAEQGKVSGDESGLDFLKRLGKEGDKETKAAIEQFLSNLSKTSNLDAAVAQRIRQEIESAKTAGDFARSMKEAETATKEAINAFVLQLDSAVSIISTATQPLSEAGRNIANRANSVNNPAALQAVAEIQDVFANPLSRSAKELEAQFYNLTKSVGISSSNFANDTRKAILGLAELDQELPKILSDAAAAAESATPEDARSTILSSLESSKSFAELPTQLQDILYSNLEQTLTNREADLGSGSIRSLLANSGFIDELTGGIKDEVLKAGSEVVKTFNELNKSYESSLQTIIDTNIKIADLQNNVFNIQARNRNILAQAGGRELTLGERLAESRSSVEFQANRAGASSSNVEDLRSNFFSLIAERDRLQARREGLISSGSNVETELAALADPIRKNAERLDANNKALDLVAKSTAELSEIQNELKKLEQQKESSRDFIKFLRTAGPEQRAQLNTQVNSALQLVSGGAQNLTGPQIADALQILDRVKSLFSGNAQQRIDDAINNLLIESDRRGLGPVLNADVEGGTVEQRSRGTDEQTQQTRELLKFAAEQQVAAAQAQVEAAQLQAPQQEALLEGLRGFAATFERAVNAFNERGFASGGVVGGAYKGKDSVPAMLMPGEFVVRRDAAKNNIGLLRAINSGNTQYMANGGRVLSREELERVRRIFGDEAQVSYESSLPIGREASSSPAISSRASRSSSIRTSSRRQAARNAYLEDKAARRAAFNAERLNRQNSFRASRGLEPTNVLANNALSSRAPVQQSRTAPAQANAGQQGNVVTTFSAASKELIPSLNSFNTAVNNLVRVTEQLQNISIPESISIDFGKPLQVNLSINGADALANMEPALQEMIASQVNTQIRKFINPLTGETTGGSDIA